jgi:hypothetical protein
MSAMDESSWSRDVVNLIGLPAGVLNPVAARLAERARAAAKERWRTTEARRRWPTGAGAAVAAGLGTFARG